MAKTPDTNALQALSEKLRATLSTADDGAQLTAWEAPYFVPGVGLVARVALFDKESYRGPNAELVVMPEADLDAPDAALFLLQKTLDAWKEKGLKSALDAPLEDTLGLSPAHYAEGMFAPDEAAIARRRTALAIMNDRFDAVSARMRAVYGLRLPRYMATFAAFWRSLDAIEKVGMESLGRSPGGIMVWFEDGGLDRKTRGGLDPRLECRFRADPPELVTVMWGDSDGLHYGLWYDDPADLPTHVAHNYARDSAETWKDNAHTPLGVLLQRANERIDGPYNDEPAHLPHYAVREALRWFSEPDGEALKKDPPPKRWLDAPRIPSIGTFGPALPKDAGTIRVGDAHARVEAWKGQPARVRKWIASAKRDCAEGKPAAALTFGLDLHWLDKDEYRSDALELLLMAYEKLGRKAHADTIKVHYAHRDLPSVGVFLREGEEETAEGEEG